MTSGAPPTATSSADAGPRRRVTAIDVARGLAILGVVLNHAINGLAAADVVDNGDPIDVVNDALYIGRMPALAFLLGLFIPVGIVKWGTSGYIRRRVGFAMWVYLVWFAIQTMVEVATSPWKNVPTDPAALLRPWIMPAQLWFLPYLAVASVVIPLALSVSSRLGRPWTRWRLPVLVFGSLALSWGLWSVNSPVIPLRGLSLLGFSAVGALVGLGAAATVLQRYPDRTVAAGAFAVVSFLAVTQSGLIPATLTTDETGFSAADSSADDRLASLVAAALAVVIVLALAVLLDRTPLRRALRYIGQRTLEIFVVHVIVVAAVRIILMRLGVNDLGLLLAAMVIAGVAAPLLLAALAPRVGLDWIFRPPWQATRVSPDAAGAPDQRVS